MLSQTLAHVTPLFSESLPNRSRVSQSTLCNRSSGSEIWFPSQISAGFLSGKPQHRFSGRPKAEAFPTRIRPKSSPEARFPPCRPVDVECVGFPSCSYPLCFFVFWFCVYLLYCLHVACCLFSLKSSLMLHHTVLGEPPKPFSGALPYVTQKCFRARNQVSGPDFGRIPIGRASKSALRPASAAREPPPRWM